MRRSVWLMLVMVLHAAVMPWVTPSPRAVADLASCCAAGSCCCTGSGQRDVPCPCAPRPERPTSTPAGVAAVAVKTEASAAAAKRAMVRAVRFEGGSESKRDAGARVATRAAGTLRAWRGPPTAARSVLNIWTT